MEIWDVEEGMRVRQMAGHASRVSAACWSPHLLSTAGKDMLILNRDIRVPEDTVATLHGHVAEVCSLKVCDEALQESGTTPQALGSST